MKVEGKQRNFLEEAAILETVETEGVNYAEAVRRLALPEKKTAPRAEPRPAHWIENEDD